MQQRRITVKRVLLTVLGAVAVLLVWQPLSYALLAENAKLRTIDRLLPQHTHFPGADLKLACVDAHTCKWLTADQKQIVEKALKGHFQEVHFGLDSVPASKKTTHTNKAGQVKLDSLQDGCLLGFQLKESGLMWFRGDYWDYEGDLASSNSTATFVWILGFWWVVRTELNYMS